MALKPVGIGVIGCGNISGAYFPLSKKFPILNVVACTDLIIERAENRAKEFGVPVVCRTNDELVARDDVELVLNITTPQSHEVVSTTALRAGKHVFSEKPLGVTRKDGQKIMALAAKKGLRVGCAPDTVLGGGHQTARKLIDDGAIGQPLAAVAFMTNHGHEHWHPDPEFYYKLGGGPMMDMGPYYLTDLTMLLGPIRRVTALAKILISPRTITSKPKFGTKVEVETPDHVAGSMEFANGAVGTIITSFAVHRANLPWIEVYGTEGSISVPDPNGFGGTPKLFKAGEKEWREIPPTHSYLDNRRSLGLADMATALRSGREHRASGEQAYHVLDVMHGFLDSARTGKAYEVPSTFTRKAPMAMGLTEGVLDE